MAGSLAKSLKQMKNACRIGSSRYNGLTEIAYELGDWANLPIFYRAS
jgi:hypothetical protein